MSFKTDWQALGLPSEPGKTAFDVQIKPTELTPQQIRNKAKWENKKKNRAEKMKEAATRVNQFTPPSDTFADQCKTAKILGRQYGQGRDL